MVSVKGVYNGRDVQLIETLPKKLFKGKNVSVVVTFLEEEKVPPGTVRAIRELLQGKTRSFDEVLNEL